jgi:aminobenzoyl-glutamate utilization protein B
MKKSLLFVVMVLGWGTISAVHAQSAMGTEEKWLVETLESNIDPFADMAMEIWKYAEVGYQEYKSSQLLQDRLKTEGFSIETGVAGIPTAFVASYGSGSPVIAILGEFDALPGVSQAAVPFREARPEVNAGHACGHHLFGSGSAAAAAAVKQWMAKNKIQGTLRFYGTPAEEGGAGKVYMVREGLFADVDAVLHWHPGSSNSASASSSLANKSAKFRFYGIASHAAASPWNGRSALDGVESMNYMINMMREHMPAEARVHYVITKGGEAPNVVPAYAEVFYYVRHPDAPTVKNLFERVVKAAEGAALGTGTKMEYEVIHGLYNLLPNETLAEMMYTNLTKVGGVDYTAEERAFGEKIISSYEFTKADISTASQVEPYEVIMTGQGGSTDVGDVSWVVPTAGMRAATWVPGTSAHSWQAVAAGGTSIGKKGMVVAAKTLALTAQDLFQNPEVMAKAKAELHEKRGAGADFIYEALLGDRKPPLDYRK